jgi:hypothetical protein
MGEREKKFFLYAPAGSEKMAQRLLEDNHISYAGLRVYRISNGTLSVTPIKTSDSDYDHRVT